MRRLAAGLLFLAVPLLGAVSPALENYLTGLDALRQGRYPEATASLAKAIAIQADPAFFMARGVSECLGGQAQEAIADLQRAKQGNTLGREPELWIYITETLNAFVLPEHRIGGPRAPTTGPGADVSMPGNMIQGGNDYPTDYASFVFQEMARPVANARVRNIPGPSAAEEAKLKLQAGAWFANRAATRKDLAEAHLARAGQQHDKGQYADVIQTAQFIRPVYPDDPQTQYLVGDSWDMLGRPATARKQLTIALTNGPALPNPYVARALAAAQMGDDKRARADLDVLQKLNPASAAKYRADIEKLIAANKVPGDPAQLYAALEREARGGALMDGLVTRAMEFERAAANGRKHYDEWYQDQYRQLDATAGASPHDPGPIAKAARFILDESSLSKRGESVEPRRGLVGFRNQTSELYDVRKAAALCDVALKMNPNHVAAMMTKAMAIEKVGRLQEAEQLVDRALQVAPRNPEALTMRAQFLVGHANSMFGQASALRTPTATSSSHDETRSDGVYEVTETTFHEPTPQALAQAAQLEAAAEEYMRRSEAAIQAALAVSKGSVEGLLIKAEWDAGSRHGDLALTELQQAVKQAPQSLEANWALADLYRRMNQTALWEQQLSVTMNLVETSCGWMLHQAWRNISENNPQAAAHALDMARQLDPTDGRVATYSGVVAQMNGNAAEAQAQFRVALAVEDAKIRLDSLNPSGANLPRDPQQLALQLRLRTMLAEPLLTANPRAAITALEPGAVWAVRTPRAQRSILMFGAMLPDPKAPAIPVPAPENAATLLGRVALDYGKALKANGQASDALAQFLMVIGFGPKPGVVGIMNGNGKTNFDDIATNRVISDARLQAAKVRLEERDCRGALEVLNFGGGQAIINAENRSSPEVVAESTQLVQQAQRCSQQPVRKGR
jgi:Tfp pilus assembly protein PilF